MKHYSPSTGGFFDKDIHGENIPDDVVDLTEDEWQRLLEGQSQGKRIVAGQNGHPTLVDYAWTDQELAAAMMKRRNAALQDTDWIVARHRDELEAGLITTIAPDDYVALQRWRSLLRALPTQPGYPRIPFPEMPVK